MNTRSETSQGKSSDVEGGVYDTGMAEGLKVRSTSSAVRKVPGEIDVDDPKSEINYYGVGVNKLESSGDDAPTN